MIIEENVKLNQNRCLFFIKDMQMTQDHFTWGTSTTSKFLLTIDCSYSFIKFVIEVGFDGWLVTFSWDTNLKGNGCG